LACLAFGGTIEGVADLVLISIDGATGAAGRLDGFHGAVCLRDHVQTKKGVGCAIG